MLGSLVGTIFIGKIEQKQAILRILLLLNVLSCLYLQKNGTLCMIYIKLTILNYINIKSIQKHFCRLQFRMPGMLSFNRLINQRACTLCVIW